MRIQHNIMAMNSYRNLSTNNTSLSKNLEKLSSGYRINRAGDDAAGLAISEKMRAQIAGLDQAQKNAQSGINLVKTAEGALTEVHDMLNRMVTLATQSANGTYIDNDRSKLQAEVDALVSEINRIADNSNFNGQKLLDGALQGGYTLGTVDAAIGTAKGISAIDVSNMAGKYNLADAAATNASKMTLEYDKDTTTFTLTYTADDEAPDVVENVKLDAVPATGTEKEITFSNGLKITVNDLLTADIAATVLDATKNNSGLQLQIGASKDETIFVNVKSMKSVDLGIDGLDIGDVTKANTAIDTINAAIEKVSVTRGDLGAIQNRLEHTINNLGVMEENIQDAESNIRDTDIADEMMAYTKNNILIQSAQAMLAQANQVPQGVLQLMQ